MLVAWTNATGILSPAPETVSLWRKVIQPIDPFLRQVSRRLAQQVESFEAEIVPYAKYALTNQGKQLRPALLALSAGTVGTTDDAAVDAAVVIEMIHLATLVHDDVMDEAAVRRRRPTLAANWGNQVSVLLGDCLFAHALRLAAGFPTTEVCRAVAAATKTVCSGEILQTHRQGEFAFTRKEYFRILQMKTAELFALSCDLGAWLGAASSPQRAALRQFGLDLGTAYQVYDDCLDIFGSEARAGKSLGTDLANGKLTLPLLIALERAEPGEVRQLRNLIKRWDGRHVSDLMEVLEVHRALPESQGVIHSYLEKACRALGDLPVSRSRESLEELTRFLAKQTDDLGVRESG